MMKIWMSGKLIWKWRKIFLFGGKFKFWKNAWISFYASGAVFCAALCLDSTGISSSWIHWLVLRGLTCFQGELIGAQSEPLEMKNESLKKITSRIFWIFPRKSSFKSPKNKTRNFDKKLQGNRNFLKEPEENWIIKKQNLVISLK